MTAQLELSLEANIPADAGLRPLRDELARAVGPQRLASLTWWCQFGNREMCAATIWRAIGCTQADADRLVELLAATS